MLRLLLSRKGGQHGRHTQTRRTRRPEEIGPSNISDTIADRPGEPSTDSDAEGTGNRATVGSLKPPKPETATDRVVNDEEAGLGGGLDQAEEAQLGVTDEEIKKQRGKA